MKFKTTREDYDKAVQEVLKGGMLDECCLIAQTFKRMAPGKVRSVGCAKVFVDQALPGGGTQLVEMLLPHEVEEAISHFDGSYHAANGKREFHRDGFVELEFELAL